MRSTTRPRRPGVVLVCTSIALGSVTLLVSTVLGGKDRETSPATAKPAWTLDLRPHGFKADLDVTEGDGDSSLAFGTDAELVVIDSPMNAPDHTVRAFVIDTASGVVTNVRQWHGLYKSAVFATAAGQYAVLDSGTVLYGSELKDEIASSPHWVESISPRGGRLAAPTRPVKKEVWIAMDAATLSPAETLVSYTRSRSSLSDDAFATLAIRTDVGPRVEIRTHGEEPVVYSTGREDAAPYFVSETRLVVVFEDRFEIIGIDGRLLLKQSGGWDVGTKITPSRGGRRFAVRQERYKGHWQTLKDERVTVYDLEVPAPIWSVKHDGMRGAFAGHSGVALSPDGSRLAIHSSGEITLYRIPESKAR